MLVFLGVSESVSQSGIVSHSLACVAASRKVCMFAKIRQGADSALHCTAELCKVQNYSRCKIMQDAKLQRWHLKMPGKVKVSEDEADGGLLGQCQREAL